MLFADGGGGLSEETLEQSTAGGEGATSASGGRAFQEEVHSRVSAKVQRQAYDGLVQTSEGQCGWDGGRGASTGQFPQGWAEGWAPEGWAYPSGMRNLAFTC